MNENARSLVVLGGIYAFMCVVGCVAHLEGAESQRAFRIAPPAPSATSGRAPNRTLIPELRTNQTVMAIALMPLTNSAPTNLVVNSRESVLAVASEPPTNRGSVRLAWDPSSGPNILGYALYFRPTNSATWFRADVGPLTKATLAGIAEGVGYQCHAVAYNTAGIESPSSNEINFVVPARVYLRTGWFFVESYGVAGKTNLMQASTNLQNWSVVAIFTGQPDVLFRYVETNETSRYFRVVPAP